MSSIRRERSSVVTDDHKITGHCYAATIICHKNWEILAATVNAKVEFINIHDCERVILRWETKEIAAGYEEGHPLHFHKMPDAAAYVGDVLYLKTK